MKEIRLKFHHLMVSSYLYDIYRPIKRIATVSPNRHDISRPPLKYDLSLSFPDYLKYGTQQQQHFNSNGAAAATLATERRMRQNKSSTHRRR